MEIQSANERRARREQDVPVLTQVVPVRRDIVKLCAVEIAISLKDMVGTKAAAEYLRRHQVDLDVARRVLLNPAHRRYGG